MAEFNLYKINNPAWGMGVLKLSIKVIIIRKETVLHSIAAGFIWTGVKHTGVIIPLLQANTGARLYRV